MFALNTAKPASTHLQPPNLLNKPVLLALSVGIYTNGVGVAGPCVPLSVGDFESFTKLWDWGAEQAALCSF